MRSDAVILISAIRVSILRDVGELVCKLVSAAAELLGFDLEAGEPAGEVVLLQFAVLEGVEVTVDGLVGLGEFGFGAGEFCALVVLSGEVLGLRADDGVSVDAGGVALVAVVSGAVEAGSSGTLVLPWARVPIMALSHFGQRILPVSW